MSSAYAKTDVQFRFLLCRVLGNGKYLFLDRAKKPERFDLVAVLKSDGLYIERFQSQPFVGVLIPLMRQMLVTPADRQRQGRP